MRVKEQFLINYTKTLTRSMNKKTELAKFLSVYNKPKFAQYTEFNYQETQAHLLELKPILDKITSIVFNPHIKSTTEEVVIRSELAASLSNESFNQTIRDSKLWRNKNGEMTPEYVHTREHIDTVVTYENTFICLLLDKIGDEIDEILSNLTPLVKSIETEFEVKGLSYGVYSPLSNLEPFTGPYKNAFLLEKSASQDVFSLANKLLKKVKNIKSTEFYRLNHKNKIDNNIVPTNILVHDQLYFNCYRFYLDNYVHLSDEYFEKKNIYYYNFVISNLFNYLKDKEVREQPILSFDENENKLHFTHFRIQNGPFIYEIKEDDARLGFEISVKVHQNKTETNYFTAKYYYLVSMKYDETNAPLIDATIEDKLKDYTDVTLITQNNLMLRFNNVMNISIYQDFNLKIMKNLFASLSMLFEVDPVIYEHKCPVCGSKRVENLTSHIQCSDCNAKYSLIYIRKKPLLWIKSFRRD